MPNPIQAVSNYIKSSIAELKKVTWPSRELTIRYSVLVIVVSLALAGFFAALDFGLSRAVTAALTARTNAELAKPAAPATPPVTPTVSDVNVETSGAEKPKVEVTPLPINISPAPASSAGSQDNLKLPPIQK
jgi:preprotein translocase subunit SecE